MNSCEYVKIELGVSKSPVYIFKLTASSEIVGGRLPTTVISSAHPTSRGNPTPSFDLQLDIGVSIHSVRGVSQRFEIVVVITPKPLMNAERTRKQWGV